MCSSLRLAIVLFCLFLSSVSFSQDLAAAPELDSEKKLSVLKREIEKEEKQFLLIKNREKEIKKELVDLAEQKTKTVAEQESNLADMSKLEKDLELQNSQIRIARREKDVISKSFSSRIRSLYKLRRRSRVLDFIFDSPSSLELLKRSHYLTIIARSDKSDIEKLASVVERYETSSEKLKQLSIEREKKVSELKMLGKSLEASELQTHELLREQRAKISTKKSAIAKLKKAAVELEKVISNMTGGADKTPIDVPDSGITKGLGSLKGKLKFPVKGVLVETYGKKRHNEFSDIIFIKGLEIQGKKSQTVRAVADGKVIFDSSLPGYGNVVIIDHGRRYYTLYGRLAEILVSKGESVSAQHKIGALGDAAPAASDNDKSKNFYFELRYKGKALDPRPYFAKLPKLQ